MSAFLGVLRTNMLLKIPLGFGLEGCEALRERVRRRVLVVDGFRQGDDALMRAVADGYRQRCEATTRKVHHAEGAIREAWRH